jgi:DNA-binding MarR family transcriptional regulator
VTRRATRWLEPDEQAAWRAFLAMQSQLFRRLGRQLQADSELSTADFEVLVHVSEAPGGRLRAFELGEALSWEKSRLSHQLTRMERRGLVERRVCTTDGRGADVVLTDAGRATIEEAAPGHVDELRRVFVDVLTPAQLRELEAIATAVLGALAEQVS